MSERQSGRGKNLLLNGTLWGLGIVVLVLLYALITRSFIPRTDPVREENPAELVGDIIQVEVRNGCGVTGLAAQLTDYLRQHDFDVVEVGDHTSFDQEHTVVIDRVGDPEAAKKVANVLGLSEDRVVEEIRLDYYLDASIIIGKDYATLDPFKDEAFSDR